MCNPPVSRPAATPRTARLRRRGHPLGELGDPEPHVVLAHQDLLHHERQANLLRCRCRRCDRARLPALDDGEVGCLEARHGAARSSTTVTYSVRVVGPAASTGTTDGTPENTAQVRAAATSLRMEPPGREKARSEPASDLAATLHVSDTATSLKLRTPGAVLAGAFQAARSISTMPRPWPAPIPWMPNCTAAWRPSGLTTGFEPW